MNNLIGLQNYDINFQKISAKKENGPIKIRMLEQVTEKMAMELTDGEQQIQGLKLSRRQYEQDIASLQSQIKKSNEKIANIKSNKEYEAVLKEIDTLKKDTTLQENKVLEILLKIETLEEEHDKNKAILDQKKLALQKDQKLIQLEMQTLDNEIDILLKERKVLRHEIDPLLLKKYDSLREHKGGIAITPVIKGVCQVCRMGIPPQKFNELLAGKELMSCPHCMRLMYLGEDNSPEK